MPTAATTPPATGTDVIVRPVRSRADLKEFVDFPYRYYRDNRYWVAPLRNEVMHVLDQKHNAFFEHGKMQLFLAVDDTGEVLGRIAAIINGMHLKKYNDGNGFFGFFETVERYEVAEALFEAAAAWLREQGMTGVRGPANPSLNDTAGLLVGGFDREPSIMMPYNPPHHEQYLLQYGFQRAMTMWAYYVHKKIVRTEKLKRGVELLKRRIPGLHIRPVDMSRFDQEARTILHIYNDAWSNNWGHVPMTDAEFAQLAKGMRQIVDPNLVYLIEIDGEPVAFSISLPNINLALRHVRNGRLVPDALIRLLGASKFGGIYECRTLLMGVLQKWQGRGLDAVLNLATIENGPLHGYDASELSWILDSNEVMKNSLDAIGAVVDKEYAMFEKAL